MFVYEIREHVPKFNYERIPEYRRARVLVHPARIVKHYQNSHGMPKHETIKRKHDELASGQIHVTISTVRALCVCVHFCRGVRCPSSSGRVFIWLPSAMGTDALCVCARVCLFVSACSCSISHAIYWCVKLVHHKLRPYCARGVLALAASARGVLHN